MRDKAEDPTADLVDAQIVAGMLRLKYRNAVSTYQRRYPDMPRPVVDPGPGRPKLWHRTEIEKWMMRTSRDRQPRVHDRDPHYADILKGLGSHLDPAVFEDCIVDILKPEIPVAPVRGGHDGGMDGAVFDGEGVPFPLVVTTAEDVIGNLQTSLASYIKSGGKRRKAVIATSRDLTARRRRNLEDKASELGFVLVQTFDRRGVADRLYGESRWCKLLLGLTGKPPVFSQFPPSPRPLQGGQLIGRTEQTAFLTLGEGDQLLLGSPGSGKTAILADFAATTGALFVHSDDATSIANGIRDQKPSIIIVDDAQIHLGAIEELVRRRRQFGLSYRIVVSSWPNEKDLIVDMLNLDRSAVITALELTRDQIVEVIKTTDITGPNRLIAEIGVIGN